jgi:hypothetical protein
MIVGGVPRAQRLRALRLARSSPSTVAQEVNPARATSHPMVSCRVDSWRTSRVPGASIASRCSPARAGSWASWRFPFLVSVRAISAAARHVGGRQRKQVGYSAKGCSPVPATPFQR